MTLWTATLKVEVLHESTGPLFGSPLMSINAWQNSFLSMVIHKLCSNGYKSWTRLKSWKSLPLTCLNGAGSIVLSIRPC